ncbi:MAG: glutamate 5-kinase [Bacteroidales bacterium]|nr:glutamate 5-kinase [Bacteroidales bacterium]
MTESRARLVDKTRIVVKVGTSTLSFPNGKMNFTRLEKLTMVLSDLMSCGKEVILVSSGAIGVGAGRLKMDAPPDGLIARQALAAIGQAELMRIYQKFFDEYHQMVAQVLLTPEGLDIETRRINAQNTLNQLLSMKIIPVVNENDTVSTVEIQFGENDSLSARVASLIDADLLIILTDIDGFYSSDPKLDGNARILSEVHEITEEIELAAQGSGTSFGKGGMVTKINAVKICREKGIDTIILNGQNPKNILKVMEGQEIGTLFTTA